MAAEPEAQAFSQRTAGVKRRPGSAPTTMEEQNPSGSRPELKWPSQIPSTSQLSTPAPASASRVTVWIIDSSVSPSSRPNGVWPQPTMIGFIQRPRTPRASSCLRAERPRNFQRL